MNLKIVKASFTVSVLIGLILCLALYSPPSQVQNSKPLNTVVFQQNIYVTITATRNGKLVYYMTGLDPLTNLGLNVTFCKIVGNQTSSNWLYNITQYNENITYVELGYYSYAGIAPNSTNTSLIGEFIRTTGSVHAETYNSFNITGVFSGTSTQYLAGSNSSNCMGISINGDGLSIGSNDLYGYTTFSTITGIDNTFTITCEIEVSGTTT